MSNGFAPFFSLVMPVFGVERYIADAVADALVQTDNDFELILVDDCSPDRSIEVALAVAEGDPRIRVVRHAVNQGLSAARNTGINAATGSWILFPDPDDRFEETLLERIRHAIAEFDPDVVMFGHADDHYANNGEFLYRAEIPIECGLFKRGPELGRNVLQLEKQTNLGYAWNKAFKLDIITMNDLSFENNAALIEDVLFSIDYLYAIEELAVIPDMLYFYKKRLGANLTSKFVPDYYDLHRRRILKIHDYVESSGALGINEKALLGMLYGRFIMSSIERNASKQSGMSFHKQKSWLESVYGDELFQELIPYAQAPNNKTLAICLDMLKVHNTMGLLALGQAIHFIRTHNTALYLKEKSRR